MSDRATRTVAVVGAGIVGVSCAEWLRRDGNRVILIDQNPPGEGTSYGNAGILARCAVVPVPVPGLLGKVPGMLLRGQGPVYLRWRYLPRLLPWAIPYLRSASNRAVTRIANGLAHILDDTVDQHLALAKGTPAERWISTQDYLYLYRRQADFEAESYAWQLRADHGITGEPVEKAALHDLDPALNPDYQFGYRLAQHGHIKDPSRYVKDLAEWFCSQGGEFLQGEVLNVREDADGVKVVLQGQSVAAARAVMATGAWSSRLAGKLGHGGAIEAERGYHIEYVSPNHMPPLPYMVSDGKCVATPMDGRLRLAGLVEFAGLDAPRNQRPLANIRILAKSLYPDLTFSEEKVWHGARPSTPDSLPLLGASPRSPSILFAAGHQHIGLTSGPKTGRLIADLVAGRASNVDLSAFAVDRFD